MKEKKSHVLRTVWMTLVLIFLYAPILVMIALSFNASVSRSQWTGFTLNWYVQLFHDPVILGALKTTLEVAVIATVISTIIGTLGAIGSFYSKKRTSSLIDTVNQIPVINADVVTGFSLCVLLVVVFGIGKDTYIPLVLGHVTLCAPFVYLSVIPKLKQMDSSLYEAALDLGATPRLALLKVVIPQILGGMVAGFSLAITLSLDDYFIATYTKPATFDTISTYVVNATKGSQTSIKTALWALSTLIFLLVIVIVLVMNISSRRTAQKEDRL